ncbi:MAG TPA: NUDIX domain-containing protein [Mariniphaga anaerophila]|uniref:NUDIX domain-containing protein n=1 Tax=Mariniphaga anaerophila TaxID=1484053 RepID=A0A831LT36_9BACT|nr:NUDIX domain-containing protein [Mariniphaga anaerophila]
MQSTHPLKTLKYCPKCGSPAFIVSGERSLKCRDCGFHFFVNSAAAVAALVTNDEGKLLLTTRGVEPGYGKLDLPGGFIDPGESAEAAVSRELWEELGLKVKSMKYLESAPNEYIFSGFSVFTLDMAFRVVPESTENLKAMDDILDFRFYAGNEIDYSQIPAPSISHFVKQFFKK